MFSSHSPDRLSELIVEDQDVLDAFDEEITIGLRGQDVAEPGVRDQPRPAEPPAVPRRWAHRRCRPSRWRAAPPPCRTSGQEKRPPELTGADPQADQMGARSRLALAFKSP